LGLLDISPFPSRMSSAAALPLSERLITLSLLLSSGTCPNELTGRPEALLVRGSSLPALFVSVGILLILLGLVGLSIAGRCRVSCGLGELLVALANRRNKSCESCRFCDGRCGLACPCTFEVLTAGGLVGASWSTPEFHTFLISDGRVGGLGKLILRFGKLML